MTMSGPSMQAVTEILRHAYEDGRTMLYEHEVYGILDAVGIAGPRHQFIRDPEEIKEDLLKGFGKELMVKIISPDIIHKKKLGGVKRIINHDPLFVQYVVERMEAEVLEKYTGDTPPRIAGFLLVEFISYSQSLGNELLIGAKDDPAFGPVLTLSKGGDDAEFFATYYDPANLFLPHLRYEDAMGLVGTSSIRHKYRDIGHPEYLGYLAGAASSISALLSSFSPLSDSPYHIRTMDVNPIVIARDRRFVANDGYASFEKAAPAVTSLCAPLADNMDVFFHPKESQSLGSPPSPAGIPWPRRSPACFTT